MDESNIKSEGSGRTLDVESLVTEESQNVRTQIPPHDWGQLTPLLLAPIAALNQRLSSQLAAMTAALNQTISRQIADAVVPLNQSFRRQLTDTIAKSPIGQSDRIKKASAQCGWLPYRTIPFKTYSEEADGSIEVLANLLSHYYGNNEELVLEDIESRLEAYSVDYEAKATMKEAIRAHQHKLFRCSCRVLLPEIERVLREYWMQTSGVRTLNKNKFDSDVMDSPLGHLVLDGIHDLVLVDYITGRLFEWINELNLHQQEHIPNRHVAAHGWLSYSSNQNSLNTIICTNYVFGISSRLREMSQSRPD